MAYNVLNGVPEIPGERPPGWVEDSISGNIADHLNRNSRGFPGAQPVSFSRAHIHELLTQDYYLCEKTDGIRCLLFLDKNEEGEEAAYLINRKNEFYFLGEAAHFPRAEDPSFTSFHDMTLIDGELVLDEVGRPGASQKQLRFLAFDLLIFHKELVTHKPLDKRLARLHSFIAKPYKDWLRQHPGALATQPFEFKAKDMEFAYGLQMMFKEKLHKLPHGNDGLIFTCLNTPYKFGTDEHIVKWKPPHENTIDFLVELEGFPMIDPEDGNPELIEDFDAIPRIRLLIGGGRNVFYHHGMLYMEQDEWNSVKASCEAQEKRFDGRILECYRDEEGRWRMKRDTDGSPRFRDDKTEPNHYTTVDKVSESIDDAVTEEELMRNEAAIKTAWKKRAAAKEEAQRAAHRAEAQRRAEAQGENSAKKPRVEH